MMLEKVKTALRVSTLTLDGEITDIILACKEDLKLAGIVTINDDDPLIIRAVILYAKANFGYSEDAERFNRDYTRLKFRLTLAGEYNGKME